MLDNVFFKRPQWDEHDSERVFTCLQIIETKESSQYFNSQGKLYCLSCQVENTVL